MSAKRKLKRTQGKVTPSANHGPTIDLKNERQFGAEVVDSDVPVVIDFWAPWCAPCKAMGPVFEATAREFEGKVKFAKINTEASPALAGKFGITSIPSLLLFDGGEVVDARIGLTSKAQLSAMLQRTLDKRAGVGLFGKLKRRFGSSEPADAAVG